MQSFETRRFIGLVQAAQSATEPALRAGYERQAIEVLYTPLAAAGSVTAFRVNVDDAELLSTLGLQAVTMVRKMIAGTRALPTSLSTFAYAVAKNTAVSQVRSNVARAKMAEALKFECEAGVRAFAAPDESLFALDLLHAIYENLSETDRIVMLHPELGFSDAEIGELIGKSVGAVAKRRFDIRKRLEKAGF